MWAPFYTYHKIMAGLLDNWTLANNSQALDMVRGMASWVRDYAQPVPDEQWQRMLNVEYGGMNDVLYQLATVTGRRSVGRRSRIGSTTRRSSVRSRSVATS